MSSMIYTIGTALDRAQAHGSMVAVLVDSQWLSGKVVMFDGHGVVLDGGVEHCIVKIERIAAVRVESGLPQHDAVEQGHVYARPMGGGVHPMPGPREDD